MDNGSIKSIEAHLAAQAREQITELVRNMSPVPSANTPELVDASTKVDAEMQDGHAMQEDRDSSDERKPLPAAPHVTADKVVIENSQSRLYEKFVRDGSESQPDELKSKEDSLLEILDEVDDGATPSATSSFQSTQNLNSSRPVPVVNVEFDESMLFDAIEEEDCEDEDDGGEEDYDDSQSDESESDDEQTLKETDPGYFHSIVTKV